jgi:CBS domain-containing protein
MIMLSTLLRCTVTDQQGRAARLLDLAVDVAAGDYPPVTCLLVQERGQPPGVLPWETARAGEPRGGRLPVADLAAARPVAPEETVSWVLLKRDILDALVIDLRRRTAWRTNDLWLTAAGDRVVLAAADAGAWAILRRLSRGALGHTTGRDLHDWKDIEFLRGDPAAARAGADYHRRIERLPAGEIASLCEAVPYLHAAELLTLLPDPLAADVFELMTPERQLQVFAELAAEQSDHLLARFAPDVAADLLARLPTDLARAALERLAGPRRALVIELLRNPEEEAGGIMTNEIVTVPAGLTIAAARDRLREPLRGPDFVYFVYVVDGEEARRLRGVLSLRDLLVADDRRWVDEVMVPAPVTVPALEAADLAAQRVLDSHLAALPVVGHNGRLLGAVTVDAAVARLAPLAWRMQAPRVFS